MYDNVQKHEKKSVRLTCQSTLNICKLFFQNILKPLNAKYTSYLEFYVAFTAIKN